MSEPDKIQKLEETVKFLRKELESQNLAILRIERALESGDVAAGASDKPALSLADIEFVVFGIEEKLKKHNDLIKNIVISLVGTNDLLEEIRDLYRSSLSEIKLEQEEHMKYYQKLLASTLETLRGEFLLVLRDFREKYPELEARKVEAQSGSPTNLPTRKIESSEVWLEEQLNDLNQRNENIELFIEQNIDDKMSSVFEMLNHLTTKIEHLHRLVSEGKVKEEKLPSSKERVFGDNV